MQILDAIYGLLKRISLWAVWASGLALLLCAIMVTIDVLCRKFLGVTMSGSDEISGYVFAIGTTWSYSYVLLNRSNVRIDALYNFLPIAVRATLDVLGLSLLLIYMAYLTTKAFDVFWQSWKINSVSTTTLLTPLWIPQLLWFIGLSLFVITLVFLLLYTVTGLLQRNYPLVQRLVGAMNAEEEIIQETHGLDVRTSLGSADR